MAGGAWGLRPAGVSLRFHRYCNHAPSAALALKQGGFFATCLTVLLELLHASERVREDGDEAQQIGNDVREGLLLACRGLSEYVDEQVQAA